MTPRETKLIVALDGNVTLRIRADWLIAAYVAPEDRSAIISELIALFDGPQQREAQWLVAEALGRAEREERYDTLTPDNIAARFTIAERASLGAERERWRSE